MTVQNQNPLFGAGQAPTKKQATRWNDAIGRQLDQIARIHSRDVDNVQVMNSGSNAPPGWSQKGNIVLNADALGSARDVDGLAVWLGVLMHEVGHCTYSPDLANYPPHLRRIANMVEDQREEALVLDDLPGAVGGFTQAVVSLILRNGVSPAGVWPLVAGRLYLPADLRAVVRHGAEVQKGKKWVKEINRLIREFKRLADPGFSDLDEAVVILEALAELLDQNYEMGDIPELCEAHGTKDPAIAGVPVGAEADDDDEEAKPGDEPDESESEGADGGGADADEDGDGESDGEGDGTGSGAGDGHSEEQAPPPGEVRREMRKIAKVMQAATEQVDKQLREQARIILRRARADDSIAERDSHTPNLMPPSAAAIAAEQRLLGRLRPLLIQAEAGLDRMVGAGRVRPDRIAAGYRPDHVFDKWKIDQHESVEAEIVVAVDVSGSMGHHMVQLSEVIWVMKQVTSKTSARLRVLLWDTRVVEFVPSKGRLVDRLGPRGGTAGAPVMELANDIFSVSPYKRRWMLLMTDGGINDNSERVRRLSDQLVKKHKVAVTVFEFGPYADGSAFGDTRHKIESLDEMPELLGRMLTDLYRKNIA